MTKEIVWREGRIKSQKQLVCPWSLSLLIAASSAELVLKNPALMISLKTPTQNHQKAINTRQHRSRIHQNQLHRRQL